MASPTLSEGRLLSLPHNHNVKVDKPRLTISHIHLNLLVAFGYKCKRATESREVNLSRLQGFEVNLHICWCEVWQWRCVTEVNTFQMTSKCEDISRWMEMTWPQQKQFIGLPPCHLRKKQFVCSVWKMFQTLIIEEDRVSSGREFGNPSGRETRQRKLFDWYYL